MPSIDLYVEVTSKTLVFGLSSGVPFRVPDLHTEDNYVFRVFPLRRRSYVSAPYFSFEGAAGYQVRIAIGTAGVINAYVDLTDVTDQNRGVTGPALSLDTTQINALADGAEQILEIKLFDGTNRFRVQQRVTIRKSVSLAASLIPVVNDTALGSNEAKGTYVTYELPPGKGLIFNSKTTGKRKLWYLEEDGEMRLIEIT